MRKLNRFFIAIAVLVMGGAWTLPSFAVSSPIQISITLPQESLSLQDLDARDEFNRPIKNWKAKHHLETLFTNSLLNLISQNLTPAKRSMLKLLAYQWDHRWGWITRSMFQNSIINTIWINKKKFFDLIWVSHFIDGNSYIASSGFLERNTRNSFSYLVCYILSSTILLR